MMVSASVSGLVMDVKPPSKLVNVEFVSDFPDKVRIQPTKDQLCLRIRANRWTYAMRK